MVMAALDLKEDVSVVVQFLDQLFSRQSRELGAQAATSTTVLYASPLSDGTASPDFFSAAM